MTGHLQEFMIPFGTSHPSPDGFLDSVRSLYVAVFNFGDDTVLQHPYHLCKVPGTATRVVYRIGPWKEPGQ
jgi:hypothetical protein